MLLAPSSTSLPSLPVLNGRCYITELDAVQRRWHCPPGANPLPFSSAGEWPTDWGSTSPVSTHLSAGRGGADESQLLNCFLWQEMVTLTALTHLLLLLICMLRQDLAAHFWLDWKLLHRSGWPQTLSLPPKCCDERHMPPRQGITYVLTHSIPTNICTLGVFLKSHNSTFIITVHCTLP